MGVKFFLKELAALVLFELLNPRTTLVPVTGSMYSVDASVTGLEVCREVVREL